MTFIFLSCREKAHDNKEFSRDISKPRHESRPVEPCELHFGPTF